MQKNQKKPKKNHVEGSKNHNIQKQNREKPKKNYIQFSFLKPEEYECPIFDWHHGSTSLSSSCGPDCLY